MESIRSFIVMNFDNMLLVFLLIWALLELLSIKARRTSAGEEIGALFSTALEKLSNRTVGESQLRNWIVYIPFMTVGLLILLGIHNVWFLLVLFILLLMWILICCVCNFSEILLLILCSNISALLQNIVIQSFLLIAWVIFPDFLPKPSKMIPIICWIGCLYSAIILLQLLRKGKKNTVYSVSSSYILVPAFVQCVMAVALWLVGGYQFSRVLETKQFSWLEFLQKIVLYDGDIFICCMRYAGVVLIVSLLFVIGHLVFGILKYTINIKEKVLGVMPLGMIVAGLVAGGLYICSKPNYLCTLQIPLKYEWGYTDGLAASSTVYHNIDAKQAVLINGAPFYLETGLFPYGDTVSVSVEAISDFSDRPYLRFYQDTICDGCVKIWVENQGVADATNCQFRLFDRQGELKEHFSSETLSTTVSSVPAGARLCLFSLNNEEMLKTQYEEIPLEMSVEAVFSSGDYQGKMTKSLPVDAMLSMRGVTIENIYPQQRDGQIVSMHQSAQWTSDLNYRYDKMNIGGFYCEKTMLLKIQVVVNNFWGGKTELTPVVFIYEVP